MWYVSAFSVLAFKYVVEVLGLIIGSAVASYTSCFSRLRFILLQVSYASVSLLPHSEPDVLLLGITAPVVAIVQEMHGRTNHKVLVCVTEPCMTTRIFYFVLGTKVFFRT